MNINDLQLKYGLMQGDFWELQKGAIKKFILSHDACEKIAAIEKIDILDLTVLNSEQNFCRLIVTARKENKIIKTIGEATYSPKGDTIGNCKSNYIGCMAEKRGVDRSILKLIDAYQYGVYSETESDSFQRDDKPEKKIVEVNSGSVEIQNKSIVEIQNKTEELKESVLNLMETREFDIDKFFQVFQGKENLDQFTHADLLKAQAGLLQKPIKGAL